jgi:hypothetical protein
MIVVATKHHLFNDQCDVNGEQRGMLISSLMIHQV